VLRFGRRFHYIGNSSLLGAYLILLWKIEPDMTVIGSETVYTKPVQAQIFVKPPELTSLSQSNSNSELR
jgi:hypothetical protein